MEGIVKDLRLAVRRLMRNPLFTVAAVFALTLGIGATSAMLIVVDGVLVEELPYEDPQRLVIFQGTYEQKGEVQDWPVSQVDFWDWRERSESFSRMSVYTSKPLSFNLQSFDEPQRIQGELVSHTYFGILGVEPHRGRFFTPEEDSEPFAHPVTVLSYGFWSERFGADPAAVGDTIRLDGRIYTIVGVAPRSFRGLSDEAQLWVPSMMPPGREPLITRRYRWLSGVARLAPEVSLQQAQAEMDSITTALAEEFPEDNQGMGVRLEPLREHWFGDMRYALTILSVGALLLLLIASANVANLQLARAIARQRAVAVRTAMGASRRRLARELLVESLLLVFVAAALGVALAYVGTRALVAVGGVGFQSFVQLTPDLGVVGVVVALAVACGVGFGLVPIAVTFRADLTQVLQQESKRPLRGFGRQGFQASVAVAQIALTLVLLVGAGLMVRGFDRLLSQDLGYRTQDVLTMRMELKSEEYSEDGPIVDLMQQLYDRLQSVPGAESVVLANPTVPTDGWVGGYMTIEDYVSPAPDGVVPAMVHAVSPGYFSMLDIALLDGRTLRRQDTETRYAVVSESFADKYWSDGSPLGKRFKMGSRDGANPWLTIVGVVEDVQHRGYTGHERPAPDIYTHLFTFPIRLKLTFNVLAVPEPGVSTASLTERLETRIGEVAPDIPVFDVRTLDQRLARQTERERFQVLLIGLFTVMALILATIGIYSVVSYGVARRTREIGIRKALGADRSQVIRWVVGRGALLAAIGLGIGLVGALAVGRFLESLVYDLSTNDPLVLVGTTLFLFVVALAASYFPARRAAKLDATTSLRIE